MSLRKKIKPSDSKFELAGGVANGIAVHAKPRLSQVNVRQNLYATGRKFGFTCHNDR